MARYGVNVAPPTPPKSEAPGGEEPEEPEQAAPSRLKIPGAPLVMLYAFAVAVTPEFNFLGIPKVRFTDLLVPFLYLSYIAAQRGIRRDRKFKSKFRPLITGLMWWNFGALFLWGQAKYAPGIFYLAKRLEFFLVAMFVGGAVRSEQAWKKVVRVLVFSCPVLSFFVLRELREFQSMGGVYATQDGMRASGLIANQETSTALFIVVVACVVLGAWDAFKDPLWRVGTIVSLVTGCAAVLATGSRGGMACMALSVVLFCVFNPRQIGKTVTLGVITGALAWTFTPATVQGRLASLFPETQRTLDGLLNDRGLLPETGSSSVTDRAITAQWFFSELAPKAGVMGLGAGWKQLGAIDNFYLSEWLYHGLIGVFLFVRVQLALFAYCTKAAKEAGDPAEKGYATGATIALLVMSASCIHGDTFYLIRPMECFALVVGLVIARRAMKQ